MEKECLLQKFRAYGQEMDKYNYIDAVTGWDSTTVAPRNDRIIAYRAAMSARLAGEKFAYQMRPEHLAMLEEIAADSSLDLITRRSAEIYLKDLEECRYLTQAEYMAVVEARDIARMKWQEAKEKADWSIFLPHLEKTMADRLRIIEKRGWTGHPYDCFLQDKEPGMTMAHYDQFFGMLRDEIVPLWKKVREEGRELDDSILFAHYPEQLQRKGVFDLMEAFGFDKNAGAVGDTTHPYTTYIGPGDVRIALYYDEHNVAAALLSTAHELGHALTSSMRSEAIEATNLREGNASGISESLSRYYENNVARSEAFWEFFYPKMQALYPEVLGSFDRGAFVRALNKATAQPIRMDADELTYPLHILFRYEIEKAMCEGSLALKDIPAVWKEKCEAYLGYVPQNDAEGPLQDVHWASAGVATFPAYAIGSAYACQYEAAMGREFDVQAAYRTGDFQKINGWMRDKLMQYGSLYDPNDLLRMATGETFNPRYYVDYLKNKYTALCF